MSKEYLDGGHDIMILWCVEYGRFVSFIMNRSGYVFTRDVKFTVTFTFHLKKVVRYNNIASVYFEKENW